jgi:predicted nuclease of restriction endonuclease-like (RecB) superfamily
VKTRKIEPKIKFSDIVSSIVDVHRELSAQASRAVNISLTLRNWMIGYYIDAFELRGADRADYGDQLFAKLSGELTAAKLSNCDKRQLYRYLRLFRTYPQIVGTLSPQLQGRLSNRVLAAIQMRIAVTPSPQLSADNLLSQLAYSHLEILVDMDDSLKRRFFEIECATGNWSVRELRRQVASLYFERSSLSTDKKTLALQVKDKAEQRAAALNVRDPYVFEFLGIKPREVMHESDIEDAILNNLQEFLLELGHGFCFEARQKRLLIGGEHFFVDLVFYNRVLKCHVLIELKTGNFSHEHIGQLNTYVSWYKKNMVLEGDNPPIGILLCTQKNQPLVEFALAGMDNQLFVSKYQLELPKREEIERFLAEKLREAGIGVLAQEIQET